MALLRIGSRGSALALWQANHIAATLQSAGHQVEIEIIKTIGDKVIDIPLSEVGAKSGVDKGIFTKEIEDALLHGRVNLAVHSLKDLPTELSPEFQIAAIPKREDASDAFCSLKFASIEQLPPNARVGTSSLRRQAQLRSMRQDLNLLPLRGNVDTRLRKLASEEYDAMILAAAGLNRLGQTDAIRQLLPVSVMCPAAGQGALAIEIRAGDSVTLELVKFLDDRDVRAATTCERTLLNRLGGGCQVPIGAFCQAENGRLRVDAVVASPNGTRVMRKSQTGNDPIELGEAVGDALLRDGAEALIHALEPIRDGYSL
jgi:hydroxymethylbilane synthase